MGARAVLHPTEGRDVALSQLKKKELKLKQDFLVKAAGYQTVCNELIGELGLTGVTSEFLVWNFSKILKQLILFPLTGGGNLLYFLYNRTKKRSATVLGELKKLEQKRREIEKAQEYFRNLSTTENEKELSQPRELTPWVEKLVASSLTVMPQNSYEELLRKRKDPYLRLLHIYAYLIAFLLSGGLIIFYLIYRRTRDPNYRFLDSELSKHVIERAKFSNYLKELVEKERNYDSITHLAHFYSRDCEDQTNQTYYSTRVFKSNVLKTLFMISMTFFTGGFLPLYIYWCSAKYRKNKDYFYRWWAKRRTYGERVISPLGHISRKWWGRGVQTIHKLWTDLQLSTFFSEITNNAITTSFFKPKLGFKRVNWALFWMFTSPLSKWIVNLLLLMLTYTFILIWSLQYSFAFSLTSWPMFAVAFSGLLFLLMSGYHIYLII
ncbi:hypothetical protein [Candidatus Mycoplasma haematominutum]|uniref:Uncharacterized protein n=1 Tax=Candidatus Mycoplasma haematominutum 'Birmingham 1' TaxID=1116213 RepID=G8C354_9MOLU|nr:hypothetical protein [Candidatus Mycoplasma haematominutum]CCE66752.1 hypothetical protein (homolog to MSU_0463) [Candidatus Mycoplasma haematominutum 'Birmingham 1']